MNPENPSSSLYVRKASLLFVGFLCVFVTAPGQTFLFAKTNPYLIKEFAIDTLDYSELYAWATLAAALLLNPMGRLIDKISFPRMLLFNVFFFVIGIMFLARGWTSWQLFIAFFLLRLFGQGVFVLTVGTHFAKAFNRNRGKAGAALAMGYPLSEIVYIQLVDDMLKAQSVAGVYETLGIATGMAFLPAVLFFYVIARPPKNESFPHEEPLPGTPQKHAPSAYHFKLGECLRDLRFYLLLAASSLPPIVVTALFFHGRHVFASRGWPESWDVIGIQTYAVCKAISSLVMGPIVDRFGPYIPYTALILLMAAAPTFLILGTMIQPDIIFWSLAYFICIGIALGFSAPISGVIWPMLYGTEHLGSIKGFVGTLRNGLTAIGPYGLAIAIQDNPDSNLNNVLIGIAVFTLLLSSFPFIIRRLSLERAQKLH